MAAAIDLPVLVVLPYVTTADDVRRRVGRMIAGVRVRDLERLSPRVLALVGDPSAEVARAARRTTPAVDTSPAETLVSATVGEE